MATPAVEAELEDARIVDFPLRGEWRAVHTPASRIPSHGTDMLGQRYAFDLIRFDPEKGSRYHPAGGLRTLFIGVPTRECHGWGEPIHAPLDGVVVAARDGLPERRRIHPVRELVLVLKNGLTFRPTPRHVHRVMGNHVILQCDDVYAGFAHLTTGSVAVEAGQEVRVGDVLGRVGHTGNSTAPHLHFQLMDGPDPLTAQGVPCAFREYEVWRDGGWRRVEHAIPKSMDRIRSVAGRWAGAPDGLKNRLERPVEKVFEIYIKTTPERLWQAITDPEIRSRYNFGARQTSDWTVGSTYEMGAPGAPGPLGEGVNLEVDPPRRLVQSMVALWSDDVKSEGTSRVTWEIEPVGDSCRLTVTHDQLREGANEELYGGWPMILSGLKTWLETGELLTTPGSLKYG